jgi:superfamily II DNA or RNA helicase
MEQIKKKEPKSILTKRGYAIVKSKFTESELNTIKKDLTVTPFSPSDFGPPPASFPIYLESPLKLYLPKHYAFEKLGEPELVKLSEGLDINLEFSGSLRPQQIEVIDKFMKSCEKPINNKTNYSKKSHGGLICVGCGFGKCHGINTPIRMYNGTIKMVQDIEVGDLLMGDDSKPRRVLSLASGREQMYRINQEYGDSYVVNESHILSLKSLDNKIIDINLIDLINNNEIINNLRGYRNSVDYPNIHFDFNEKIIDDIINLGYIPRVYHYNSKEIRFKLLGLFANRFGKNDNNKLLITINYPTIISNLELIANSLGFYTKSYDNFLKIYGNYSLIPNLKIDIQNPDIDYQLSRISIEKLSVDTYYGFCIDGNHRYFLGDYTVTHNTVMGLNLISLLKKKTLVIVHKEFLVNQWKKRIEEYLPTAKVGTIQGPIIDYKDKDIVIGMLQSISMKDYEDEVFSEFGFAIIDECHHIAAEVFSRALPKINSIYQLGLSATPKRPDGLSKVFHWFLGPVLYEAKKTNSTNVQVMAVHYHNNWDPGYNKEETMGFGKVCPVKMISNIVIYDRRNSLIARIVMKLVLEGRKTLILSERRDHLTAIEGLIKDFTTVGYYVGGMKQKDLDASEEKQVLLATYQMASEGMDIPSLDSVIFATPKSSIEQSIGRITRKVHENPPIAYDIVDEFSIFPNQFKKRKTVYSKLKYKITHLHIKDHIHTTIEQLTNQIEAEVLTEEQMEELIEKEIKKEEEKFKTCLLED